MTTTTCPYCHQPIEIHLTAPDWASALPDSHRASAVPSALPDPHRVFPSIRGSGRYETTAAAPWASAPDPQPEPRRPINGLHVHKEFRPATVQNDVLPTAAWAAIGSLSLMFTSIPVTIWQEWPWWTPLGVWPASFTLLYFGTGLARFVLDRNYITSETTTKARSPAPPAPPPPVEPPRASRVLDVRATSADGRRQALAELPDTLPFWQLARACALSRPPRPFSEATAADCRMPIHCPRARQPDQFGFRQVRDLFIARGWAHWKNPNAPNQGVHLTAAGRRILLNYAQAGQPDQEET